MNQVKVLLCVLGNDIHVVANRMLDLICRERGCVTVNLGALTPADEVIEAVADNRPDLLLVSTLNGQGYPEASRLMASIKENIQAAYRPAIWLGGNLFVGDYNDSEKQRYLDLGFDKVYSRPRNFNKFSSDLDDIINILTFTAETV